MSDFNPSTYQATIDQLNSGLTTLTGKLNQVMPTVQAATGHWWIPGWLADGLRWCGEKLVEIGTWVLNKLGELLEGAAAPVMFFFRAYDWGTQIGGPASGVASSINPSALRAPLDWQGDAANSYKAAVAGQSPAATQVKSVSDTTVTTLLLCAGAGLAFYVALGVILVKLIAATVAAIVALGSVVFSWAGAALIVEEAGVNTGLIVAAVATLVAVQSAAANSLVQITNAASSQTGFPGGHWPVGTA